MDSGHSWIQRLRQRPQSSATFFLSSIASFLLSRPRSQGNAPLLLAPSSSSQACLPRAPFLFPALAMSHPRTGLCCLSRSQVTGLISNQSPGEYRALIGQTWDHIPTSRGKDDQPPKLDGLGVEKRWFLKKMVGNGSYVSSRVLMACPHPLTVVLTCISLMARDDFKSSLLRYN